MRVLVISADLFEDRELTEPVDALRETGVEVDIASERSGTITGKRGAM
jgi:protease I